MYDFYIPKCLKIIVDNYSIVCESLLSTNRNILEIEIAC